MDDVFETHMRIGSWVTLYDVRYNVIRLVVFKVYHFAMTFKLMKLLIAGFGDVWRHLLPPSKIISSCRVFFLFLFFDDFFYLRITSCMIWVHKMATKSVFQYQNFNDIYSICTKGIGRYKGGYFGCGYLNHRYYWFFVFTNMLTCMYMYQ